MDAKSISDRPQKLRRVLRISGSSSFLAGAYEVIFRASSCRNAVQKGSAGVWGRTGSSAQNAERQGRKTRQITNQWAEFRAGVFASLNVL